MSRTQEYLRLLTHLTQYHEKDWETLQSVASEVDKWGPEMVNTFYDTLYSLEDTKKVFHDGERPRLEKTLASWFTDLLKMKDKPGFWAHQWVIGLLHIKRGVKNIYMLGIMNRLQQVFLTNALKTWDAQKALQVYGAFHRITGSVATMIAESYIDGLLEGLSKVGMNERLVDRVKQIEVNKMLEAAHGSK